MALVCTARLTRRTATAHLVIAFVLLSFVALEVFDIDGSNLAIAGRAAAKSLEGREAVEIEYVQPESARWWSTSTVALLQDVVSRGVPDRALSTSPRRPLVHLQGAHKALPRATLADQPPPVLVVVLRLILSR